MCSVRPALQPYFRQIIMTLLTRMQQGKTNNYVYYFVYFLLYVLAINANGITLDYLTQTVDEIQLGYILCWIPHSVGTSQSDSHSLSRSQTSF